MASKKIRFASPFLSLPMQLGGVNTPTDVAILVSKGSGLKGSTAGNYVTAHRDQIKITRKAQNKLFEIIYPIYINRAKSNYEYWTTATNIQSANISGISVSDKTPWSELDNIVKDVIVDLVYQGFTKGPKPMMYGMLNDREKYANYISNTKSLSQYKPGRHRANYLRGNY
ncbi:hypothetical protein [Plesiomonas sp.]|uniref:hypothetical protein n=1 Tax=Plesiomonas sp. TaxID=2486279 RepID=UPI003F3357C4